MRFVLGQIIGSRSACCILQSVVGPFANALLLDLVLEILLGLDGTCISLVALLLRLLSFRWCFIFSLLGLGS